MQTVNHIRSLIILILVMLIFAPTVSSASEPSDEIQVTATSTHFTKQNSTHSKNEIQLPYEEREKEEETGGEEKSKQSFIYVITEVFQPKLPFHHFSFQPSVRSCGTTSSVPLYLIKRSLLI